MLQKLGRRLTLLNMVISGAILIAMALLALGIAEGTVTTQYEEDLAMYSRTMTSIAYRGAVGGVTPMETLEAVEASAYFETPERYMVYVRDGAGGVRIGTEDPAVTWNATEVAMQAERLLEAEPAMMAIARSDSTTIAAVNTMSSEPLMAVEAIPADTTGVMARIAMPATLQVSTVRQPVILTDRQGTSYRISAMAVTADERDSLVLVMQDRSDELAARTRMRWLFVGCIAGGLVLIFLSSLFFSRRAIAPIDASIQQQRAFVAAASHELRTPVAALRANADVLSDAPLGDFGPYLASIQSVSERMSLLIADLMDLARADAGELSVSRAPVDADEVARAAAQLMRPVADGRGIRLTEDLAEAPMLGDAERLRQVLLALLDNALRYTPEGGEVRVTARREGKQVVIAVEDTGPGIPDEHKERVFDRFYRIDTARARDSGGFGLGLSIVRQLVGQMEGSIAAMDREGGGTRFEMRFMPVA